jgi:hypothetical protein
MMWPIQSHALGYNWTAERAARGSRRRPSPRKPGAGQMGARRAGRARRGAAGAGGAAVGGNRPLRAAVRAAARGIAGGARAARGAGRGAAGARARRGAWRGHGRRPSRAAPGPGNVFNCLIVRAEPGPSGEPPSGLGFRSPQGAGQCAAVPLAGFPRALGLRVHIHKTPASCSDAEMATTMASVAVRLPAGAPQHQLAPAAAADARAPTPRRTTCGALRRRTWPPCCAACGRAAR